MLVGNHPYLDVLGFCETFLNDNFSDNEFNISGYQMYRRDRKTNGGGLILYINERYSCVQRLDLEDEQTEAI